MGSPKKSACAAADLTDDLIVEILSRLPAKSICRFKCVSWHWYGLITNPEHRKKIPQTLSGFFYPSSNMWTPEDPARIIPDFIGIVGDEEPYVFLNMWWGKHVCPMGCMCAALPPQL